MEMDLIQANEDFSSIYKFIRFLGQGSFGQVVEAVDKSSRISLAVKILDKQSLKVSEIIDLRREAEILSSLSHKNVIKFIHINETRFKLFIGMELTRGRTLRDYMIENEISESSARIIFRQLLEGVNYLHSQGVIHRDLKPENIYISENPSLTVKILDFGLSKCLGKAQMATEHCGTLIYMAPEQIKGKYYGKSVDIWSSAIILYMLLAQGKHPLMQPHMKKTEFLKKLEELEWKFPENFPQKAKSLFENMVRFSPLERYTASRALQHPWVLNCDRKAPLSMFEEIKKYGDAIKLKNIMYQFMFMSLARERGLIARHNSKRTRNQTRNRGNERINNGASNVPRNRTNYKGNNRANDKEICYKPGNRKTIRLQKIDTSIKEGKKDPILSERKILRIQKRVDKVCKLYHQGKTRKLSIDDLYIYNTNNKNTQNKQVSIATPKPKNAYTTAKGTRIKIY